MSEPFSWAKLTTGLFSGVYWVKVVLYMLSAGFLLFVGIGVWRGYFRKPEPTTSQSAERMYNDYYQPRSTFGCATVKVYEKYPVNATYPSNSVN